MSLVFINLRRHQTDSYRPIGLASNLGMFLARILRRVLLAHPRDSNAFSTGQKGLLSENGPSQLPHVIGSLIRAYDDEVALHAFFIDFAAFFDMVLSFLLFTICNLADYIVRRVHSFAVFQCSEPSPLRLAPASSTALLFAL